MTFRKNRGERQEKEIEKMIDSAAVEEIGEDKIKEIFREMEQENRRSSFVNGLLSGVLLSGLCLAVFCGGWLFAQKAKQEEASEQAEESGASVLTDGDTLHKLDEVQSLIEQYYLDEVDGEKLSDYLFKGAAVGLGDDYANYYSREELTSVLDSSRGEYFGIGAVMSEDTRTGEICIVQVYEGSPAEKAGLCSGDVVMTVEEESAAALGLSDLVTKIKGAEGAFQMTVYRPDTEEELEFTLECDDIVVSHVEYEMLEDGIGYIQITEFTESAVTQFKDAVKDLNSQNMQKLIVDLRNNPGGLLTSVCDILDEVLPEGLIVYTEDKNGNREEFSADSKRSVDCEIAVLVNGYSASASEIFAGAIQDYELGPVIGTQTYGKGVVQKTYSLSDGSAFKMTVEKYFTAKGQDINGNGITPDIIIEETDSEVETEQETETEAVSDPVLERAVTELKR